MKLVFLVEEASMKALLEIILAKILPADMEKPVIIAHNGKSDLIKSIPKKLNGWIESDVKFVIIHDQDSNDCMKLKENLINLCGNRIDDCLIRIACKTLEAWYFGDLKAVSAAYGKNLTRHFHKSRFRIPDNIENAKDELRKIIPEHQQISGAKLIAPKMDVNNNTSKSFNVFVEGIKKLLANNMDTAVKKREQG